MPAATRRKLDAQRAREARVERYGPDALRNTAHIVGSLRWWWDLRDADDRRPLWVRALLTRGQRVPRTAWDEDAAREQQRETRRARATR
jgi:hypothetical protein